ncbi:hypothetical protein BASA81_010613 [Batrachochytrium salamandrivorans]|nr:hypothetical protein BASA81_010613 [Batrachochytrium salamandrivorans]
MDWVVLKYGGTSVSTKATWEAIYERAVSVLSQGQNVWITVSAITQITNKLIASLVPEKGVIVFEEIYNRHVKLQTDLEISNEDMAPVFALLQELKTILEGTRMLGEVSPRIRARVLAFGELCSSYMGLLFLLTRFKQSHPTTVQVARVDSRKLLFSNNRPNEHEENRYMQADVLPRKAPEEAEAEMKRMLEQSPAGYSPAKQCVVISQGFIAATSQFETCVLGRGGSDTSASLFAALLNAKRCEIWTDVFGLFTCDPNKVHKARLIREISYREAQELAAMGAKVLHPRCIGPVQWAEVPLEVRNTMEPTKSNTINTRVCPHPEEGPASGKPRVVAVTKRSDQILLTVSNFDMWQTSGFLSKVFAPLGTMGVTVDLVATSEYSVSMTLDGVAGGPRGPLMTSLVSVLKNLVPRGEVIVEDRVAVVSVVGRQLRHALPSLSKAFKCLKGHEVRMVTESAEDLNMSFVVDDPKREEGEDEGPSRVDQLVADLHGALFDHHDDDEELEADESLGACWDELRAKTGPTPVLPALPASPLKRKLEPVSFPSNPPASVIARAMAVVTASKWDAVEIRALWNNQSEPSLLVVDTLALPHVAVASSVHLRVAELLGKPGQGHVLAALAQRGFGFECHTLESVRDCVDAGARGVCFAPQYCAAEAEYLKAIAWGCSEVSFLDQEDVLPLANVDVFVGGSVLFRSKSAGRETRSARWDALREKPAKVVVGPEFLGAALALVSVVTRSSGEGGFKVRRGPSSSKANELGLQVLNLSKENAPVGLGDLVLFHPSPSAAAAAASGWWL